MKTFNEINYDNYQYINYHQHNKKTIENFAKWSSFKRTAKAGAGTGVNAGVDAGVNAAKDAAKKFELTKLQPNFEVMDIKDLKPDLSELSDAKDFLDNSDILKDISKKINFDSKTAAKSQQAFFETQQDITAKVIKKMKAEMAGLAKEQGLYGTCP